MHAKVERSRTESLDHLAERAVALAEHYHLVGIDLLLHKRFRRHLGTSIVGTSLVFAFRARQRMGLSDAQRNDECDDITSTALHYVAIET